MKLGQTIISIRKERKMTQEEFAHFSCDTTDSIQLGK